MATLSVDLGSDAGPTSELHEWLAGNWGMLFSNPQDFQYQGLAASGPLESLREEFRSYGVRPIAVRRYGGMRDMSWVGGLQNDWDTVRVNEPPPSDTSALAVGARALRRELLVRQPRFVLIVDGTLEQRGELMYSAGRSSVSLHDLLASVDVLRHRTKARNAA